MLQNAFSLKSVFWRAVYIWSGTAWKTRQHLPYLSSCRFFQYDSIKRWFYHIFLSVELHRRFHNFSLLMKIVHKTIVTNSVLKFNSRLLVPYINSSFKVKHRKVFKNIFYEKRIHQQLILESVCLKLLKCPEYIVVSQQQFLKDHF